MLGINWVQFYHGGLSGIAFDPQYTQNHFVYVVTQVPDESTGFAKASLIIRFTDVKGHGASPKIILKLGASQFDNTYSLVFGADGMLYIPVGFLGTTATRPLVGLPGKILRVTPDGQAPGDNPFGPEAPLVGAIGLKNSFDLAFFPDSDLAVAGENGTVGHDEINLLAAGNNYGYPNREGITHNPSLTPPMLDYESDPPPSASSITRVTDPRAAEPIPDVYQPQHWHGRAQDHPLRSRPVAQHDLDRSRVHDRRRRDVRRVGGVQRRHRL
jgi:glucose/arabinose dehydrogenase